MSYSYEEEEKVIPQEKLDIVEVVIPKEKKSIGAGEFEDCINLNKVTFEEGSQVQTIWNQAFKNCRSLKIIELPDSVVTLWNDAFEGCTALKSVKLSNAINDIWNTVFKNCTALEQIVMPSSTKKIWGNVFEGCDNLKTVFVHPGSWMLNHKELFNGVTPTPLPQ